MKPLLGRCLHFQGLRSELSVGHHMPTKNHQRARLANKWEMDGLNTERSCNYSSHKREQMVVLNEGGVFFSFMISNEELLSLSDFYLKGTIYVFT